MFLAFISVALLQADEHQSPFQMQIKSFYLRLHFVEHIVSRTRNFGDPYKIGGVLPIKKTLKAQEKLFLIS